MHIKECFKLIKVGLQNIVVATGDEEEKFGGILRLNGTGVFLWNKLVTGCEKEELVTSLMAEYGIDREVSQKSVEGFLASLRKEGVLEEK